MRRQKEKIPTTGFRECVLFFCGRSEGSIAKKCLVWVKLGVFATLKETNSHFDPTQQGRGPLHHIEAAGDWFKEKWVGNSFSSAYTRQLKILKGIRDIV